MLQGYLGGKFENLWFSYTIRSMVQKGYHCAFDAHYHIVFPVKYRKALMDDQVTTKIKQVAIEIGQRYEIEMEQIGCDVDGLYPVY